MTIYRKIRNALNRSLSSTWFYIKFWTQRKPYAFDSSSIDISLTTHGRRIGFVFIAIQSIMDGERKPRGIYLSIDNDEKLTAYRKNVVSRLRSLGVKILYGERVGPHAKYFSYLNSVWKKGDSFVLIDDDVLYRRDVLKLLLDAHQNSKSVNLCLRSFEVGISNGSIAPYGTWNFCTKKTTSPLVFATNVGGVLICSRFAERLHALGNSFAEKCPKADDIWLHWASVRYEIPYFQCVDEFLNPPTVPFSQLQALHQTNNSGGNDIQISNTYDESDLIALVGEHKRIHQRVPSDA